MLRFVYTGKVEVSGENILSILYFAHKYDLSSLEDLCSVLLKSNLSEENALVIYDSALNLGNEEIASVAQEVLAKYSLHSKERARGRERGKKFSEGIL
jgi:hypothetical protein